MAVKDQILTDEYAIYNGDCIEVMQSLPDEKIHLSVYSPPFGGLYHYSSDERDLSNSSNYTEFFEHYEFVVRELNRLTMSGRITAVHCTDIPSGNTGRDYLTDFPGDIIRLHERTGWHFIARHTIWKEPLWVRNRTLTKSLAHRTVVDDGAYAGVASADYLLVFRKRGGNPKPVTHPIGLTRYAGEAPLPPDALKFKGFEGDQKQNKFSHHVWRRYASSIWDDIRMNRVLPFQDCKDPDDEEHVHPLQLDVIDRVICLRSQPGETVLTPFMGVGSEVFGAVIAGRKGIGIELKESYFRQAVANLSKWKDFELNDSIQEELFQESEADDGEG
ncbi:MAG: site-specific DNA-methyltransferase [Patescibacteria group bacterium]|nr:site-specific DNA-methyltransferase [Patescibacteria group bacterium]